MSTWVFALAALVELREGERVGASDVMRRALALSSGEAGVYLDSVKRALELLADDGAAEMQRVDAKGGQPSVLWNVTDDGRARWANLCTVFTALVALTKNETNKQASAFARAGARAG